MIFQDRMTMCRLCLIDIIVSLSYYTSMSKKEGTFSWSSLLLRRMASILSIIFLFYSLLVNLWIDAYPVAFTMGNYDARPNLYNQLNVSFTPSTKLPVIKIRKPIIASYTAKQIAKIRTSYKNNEFINIVYGPGGYFIDNHQQAFIHLDIPPPPFKSLCL